MAARSSDDDPIYVPDFRSINGCAEPRYLELILEIVALVLTPTLIVGAAAWVLRSFFQQGLERDIERFKIRLKSEQDRAQASLQAQLQAQLFEHQTRSSVYHAKQSEVLAKTYELLFDPYEHIKEFVHPIDEHGPPTPERQQEVINLFNQLAGYYHKNRIYLPESVCEKMDVVLKAMNDALNKNILGRREAPNAIGLRLWQDSWKTMQDEVPPLMDSVANFVG